MRNCLAWRVAMVVATATGAWAQPWFAAAPSFSAGTSPTSVTAGDFNGDQKPDLAITNQHGLAILLNDGNGGFAARVDYNYVGANNPQSVATGHFNADSSLDLAVVNQGGGSVTIWTGGGNGTFSQGNSYIVGVNPRRVIVLDVNNDQKDDLVIVNSGAGAGTNGVAVLLGNGDGTFQAAKFTASGTTPISVASGDFNGDHKPDLVTANTGSDDLSVLLGNGDGTFQSPVAYSLNQPGITVAPTSVTVADFDHDGKLDLAAVTPNVKGYVVLLGLGNGAFQAANHYTLDDVNFVNNNDVLIASDMNGDTKPDLVLVNYSSDHLTLLFGAGDGTFSHVTSYAAGPEPIFAAIADFNGDTIPDLAVANFNVDGVVTLLLGTGGGGLQSPPLYRSSFIPTSLAIGDLNNDGIPDIVAGSTGGGPGAPAGVVMLGKNDRDVFGKGSGTYNAPVAWSTSGVTAIALGDFNGDGHLDLASTQQSPGNGSVSVRLGNGDGTFQSAVTYSAGTTPVTLAAADLNNDHKLDLVVGNRTSTNVSVFLGNGDGTFQAAVNYGTPATGSPESLVVADFNGDGKPDIAAAISGINSSEVYLLLGKGDGTFLSTTPLAIGFHSATTLHIASADFTGDGTSDLAVSDGTTLAILLGNTSGAIPQPSIATLVGTGAAVTGGIGTGDFNGDSIADIAVATRDGIQILLGTGSGTFAPAAIYNPMLSGALVVADLDNDSNSDIVMANNSSDQISTDVVAVLLNQWYVNPISLTVDTVPTGLPFNVFYGFPPGGILSEFSPCTGPCTVNATWGRFFQVYASPSIDPGGGVRYFLDSFSDSGTTTADSSDVIHNVLFPARAYTELIRYRSQYQVTVAVSPAVGGSATPASGGYVDANAKVALQATGNPGYTFTQWTASPGGATCGTAACSPTVSQPITWTASFSFTGHRCDLNGDSRLTVVDGQSIIAQALGLASPSGDLNHDGKVTIADAQLLLNAVMNAGACPQ